MPFLTRLRVYAKYHLPGFMVRFLQGFWRTFVHPTAQGVRRLKAWLIKTVSLGRSGPLPPDDLNFLVLGSTDPVWFLKSGRLAEKSIRNILAKNGISLKSLRGILDFGCGAGCVLRPGGYFLVSVHGAFHIRDFRKEMRDRFERGEMIVSAPETEGTNQGASFHSPAYMRSCFAPGFELIDEIPEGALGNPRQDLYLYRKR